MIVRVKDKITLYCKGAGNYFSIKKKSILTDILFLFLDSVIFARLNKESQPLKKTTFVHLTVSNTHPYIINFIHLKVPIRFKGLHSLSNSLWSSSRWSINALMWLLGSSPNTPSHLENILWRTLCIHCACFFPAKCIQDYAREGLRTLVLAKRQLTIEEYAAWADEYQRATSVVLYIIIFLLTTRKLLVHIYYYAYCIEHMLCVYFYFQPSPSEQRASFG